VSHEKALPGPNVTLPPNRHSDAEGLRRQRRLLVGVSIALTLFLVAGVSFDEVVVLGNSFNVKRPDLIPFAIWILWGYALIRYWQYFNDMPPLGFKESHYGYLKGLLTYQARAVIRRDLREPAVTDSAWLPPIGHDFEDNTVLEQPRPGARRLLVRFALTYQTERGPGREMHREHPVDFEEWPVKRASFRAWWRVATRTRLATEYLLPFAVAAIPPIVSLAVVLF
jgi:hypothetical protein